MLSACKIRLLIHLALYGSVACSAIQVAAHPQDNTSSPDAAEQLSVLLRQMEANIAANDKVAREFVGDELDHALTLNTKGKKLAEFSEKYECVGVDGAPYRRKVEENGKPLTEKQQIADQKREDLLTQIGKGRDFVLPIKGLDPNEALHSALPICCLSTLFDNRLLRHELVNGRDNIVIESQPKTNAIPETPDQTSALDWRQTTWIDVQDLIPARYEIELLKDQRFLSRGSKTTMEFSPVAQSPDAADRPAQTVWLLTGTHNRLLFRLLWSRQIETSEQTLYNFKRFRVDLRIVDGSVKSVEGANPPNH